MPIFSSGFLTGVDDSQAALGMDPGEEYEQQQQRQFDSPRDVNADGTPYSDGSPQPVAWEPEPVEDYDPFADVLPKNSRYFQPDYQPPPPAPVDMPILESRGSAGAYGLENEPGATTGPPPGFYGSFDPQPALPPNPYDLYGGAGPAASPLGPAVYDPAVGPEPYNVVNPERNMPFGISDFMREEVQPRAGDIGRAVAQYAPNPVNLALGGLQLAGADVSGIRDVQGGIGEGIGRSVVPVTMDEFGLELLPGIGTVPGAVSAARGAAGGVARGGARLGAEYAENAVRGGLALDPGMEGVMRPARPAGLMPEGGRSIGGGAWKVDESPADGMPIEQLRALSKQTGISITGLRQSGPAQAVDEAIALHTRSIENARNTIARIKALPEMGTAQREALADAQRVAKGSGYKLTALERAREQHFGLPRPGAAVPDDMAAWRESVSAEKAAPAPEIAPSRATTATSTPIEATIDTPTIPTGIVRTSKGETLPATPENVQAAVTRALSRKPPPQILGATDKGVGEIVVAMRGGQTLDPHDFVDEVARAISSSRTFGGKSLLEGVPLEQVKEALANPAVADRIQIIPGRSTNGAGVVRVQIRPESRGALSKAIAEAGSAPPRGPRPPLGAGEPPLGPTPPSYSWMPTGNEPRPTIGGTKLQQPTAAAKVEGFDWGPGTPLWRKTLEVGKEVAIFAASRTLQAGLDLSYPLRQAGTQVRRQQFWRAFDDLGKALWSQDFAVAHEAELRSLPFLTDNAHISPVSGGKFSDREENLASKIGDMLPGYRQSQRAVVTFINDMRANTVNDFGKAMTRSYGPNAADMAREGKGILTPEDLGHLEAFADYVNRATGRGNLGGFEDSIGLLNQVFYAFRRNVAMVQAPLNMFNYKHPAVAKEAMMDMVSFVGVGAATLKLADLAGADVSLDPTQADFGKIQVGDTRVDIWGGYQQMARVIYKTTAGQYKDPNGTEFVNAWLSFGRNKLSPAASLVTDVASGENAIGKKMGEPSAVGDAGKVGNEAIRRLSPLAWNGLLEAIQEDGATGAALGVAGMFGAGVQSYKKQSEYTDTAIAEDIKAGKLPATYIDDQGNEKPVKTLYDLKDSPSAVEEFEKRHPEDKEKRLENATDTTKRINELNTKFKSEQEVRDFELLQGPKADPAEWRRLSGDAASRLQAAVSERAGDYKDFEPHTLRDVANREFGKAIDDATKPNGAVDWEKVDRVVAAMSPEKQQRLFEGRLAGETDTRKAYIQDVAKLEFYFEQRDLAWEKVKQANPVFAEHESLDSFRLAKVNEVMDKNKNQLSRPTVETLVDNAIGPLTQSAGLQVTQYLAQHKDLIPILAKWGFYVPTAVRPLAAQGIAR